MKKLDRRTVLRGAGAAVALPYLEAMAPRRALAAAGPGKYFVFTYAGVSLPGRDLVVPTTPGTGYELTRGLRPLAGNTVQDRHTAALDYPSVRDEISVVSGLKIPWETNAPAHRARGWHGCTHTAVLCGISSNASGINSTLTGPTADHLVHKAIGGDKLRLKYRVQAVGYRYGDEYSQGWAAASVGASGKVQTDRPVANPTQAHRELFAAFQPGGATADQAAWMQAQEQKKSVIDLVRRNAERLGARLGTADRRRLERHFDEIRAVEKRIVDVAARPVGGAICEKPPDPGAPARTTEAWSDEETRARVMTDLVYLALACDVARSVSLMYTFLSSFMTARYLTESQNRTDVHETGHSGNPPADMADCFAWHAKHFARLVHKLRGAQTPEGTLLDQTALVMVCEAGNGRDEGAFDGATSHSSSNMIAFVAGRCGGHRPGRHIKFANDVHPVSVTLSAMRMVGVSGPLGEIGAHVPELFT